MIDSHAAASFSDSLYTDESNNSGTTNTNSEIMGISKNSSSHLKRRSFIDMDEDDYESNGNEAGVEEALSPTSYTNIGVIDKNELYSNCVEVTEIETINNNKSKGSGLIKVGTEFGSKPAVKRLKSTDFQFMNGTKSHLIRNGNFQNYQIVNNQRAIVLNNGNNSSINNTPPENQHADSNLFVNSERNDGAGSTENLIDSIMNEGVQPIVSMPDSPNIGTSGLHRARNSSRITLFNDNSLTNASGQNR